MKAILISVHAKWCALMMNGDKTIEVRKGTALYKATKKLIDEYGYAEFYVYNTRDERYRLDKELNGKYFIWDTKSKEYPFDKTRNRHYFFGKVIFKFRCYKVSDFSKGELIYYKNDGWCGTEAEHINTNGMCLTEEELLDYLKGDTGCAIHISDLEIFDKPKELSEFKICCKRKFCNCFEIKCINCSHLVYEDENLCDKRLTKAPQSFAYIEVGE